MRKMFLVIILFLFLGGCENIFGPDLTCLMNQQKHPEPEAQITIIKFEQGYYSYSQEYGSVKIFLDIRNTGEVNIDYWEAYFKATCADKVFDGWTNGFDLVRGKKENKKAFINTKGLKASSVKITAINLESY